MIDVSFELSIIKDFVIKNNYKVYCATSGGKDSAVIMHLTKQVFPSCLYIHNVKPDTHPDTINALYFYSKDSSTLFCDSKAMPSVIKQYGFIGQIDGTKVCEWNRTDKSNDVIINGDKVGRERMSSFYVENGIWSIQNLYPIYNWSDEKVFEYCKQENINLSLEYNK